jgi:hypothetical protein
MRDKKYYLVLDDFEHRIVINGLNQFRTSLITDGRDAEPVNEILLKIIGAPTKKIKVIYKEG